jgi:MFS transporter, DHA3 family, macrolide efflux protein
MFRDLKGYLLLLAFETLSATGSALTMFVLTVWVWETSHSPHVLAQVLAAFHLPKIILTPIAGVYVDRWSRKNILVVANLSSAVAVAWLGFEISTNVLSYWQICIVGAVQAGLASFRQPTLEASIGTMVPREHLTRISALTQSAHNLPEILGPLVGAVLLGVVSSTSLVAIDAASFFIAALGTLVIVIPRAASAIAGEVAEAPMSFWRDVQLGTRFIYSHRPLLMCALALALFNIFGGAFLETLILPMADTVWQHQPAAHTIASITSLFGSRESALPAQLAASVSIALFLGIVIGGALVAARGLPFKRRITSIAVGVAIAGVAQACLGASSLVVPLMASFVIGLTSAAIHAPLQSLWISKTPAAIQGRVLSSLSFISQLTYPLGLLIVSLCASLVEPSTLLIFSGVALLLSGLVWRLVPSLYEVDRLLPDLEPESP